MLAGAVLFFDKSNIMNDIKIIQTVALDVLKSIPHRPFFCLPLSALLYANLKDKYGMDVKLVTGNLTYNNRFIFEQDFEISSGNHTNFKLWGGHAWVEFEKTLWDLSFLRSLYSPKFTKTYKGNLIQFFGTGRGLIGIEGRRIPEIDLEYHPVEFLSDSLATGIIQGIPEMLKIVW